MKRYLLFTFETYYPGGGWRDFRGSYATIDEALEAAIKTLSDAAMGHYQIVDVDIQKVVKQA